MNKPVKKLAKKAVVKKQKTFQQRIKTWADAEKELSPEDRKLPFKNPKSYNKKAMNAFWKLTMLFQLARGNKSLDYTQSYWKYYNWFYKPDATTPGFAFSSAFTTYGATITCVGPRLSSDSKSDAEHIARTFPELYNDLYDESDLQPLKK